MRSRLLGAWLLAALAAVLVVPAAGPALAEEEDEVQFEVAPLPSLEDVTTGTEIAEQFRPEPPEEQPFTDALLWPLLAGSLGLSLVVLVLWLRWMPRFAREKEQARRR